ncbi:MAG TPA: hypothetical protein VLA88_00215 [Candidatus Saccharimonadales bacterium]|nr:hypothetical protein [Candidatus Saccharimonadales bacterium]
MQTLTGEQQIRERIGRQREVEYLAYHEWLESLRRDEITDAAERVRAPQMTTMEFTLTPAGLVNDLGQALRPIIEDGVAQAERMARANPDWKVELERRRLELEEYEIMESLAAEDPGSGVLLSRWMIPDSVREGKSSLPGYNRERLKMFNRYAAPTENGLVIGYQSLDGSNYAAVQAMDQALGYELPDGLGSEAVAAQRRFIPAVSLEWLTNNQREAYDASLSEQLGGEWYAGRPPIDVKEVVAYVSAQTDLIEKHMAIVHKVFDLTRDKDERMRLLESHRYNLAAAIDLRLHNPEAEVSDLQAAGDAARGAGLDYSGDCPIGTSVTEQAGRLGFGSEKVWGNCPHCKQYVQYDPCDPECYSCGANKYSGPRRKVGAQAIARVQKAKNQPNRHYYVQSERKQLVRSPAPQRSESRTINGRVYVYKKRLAVGGTNEVLIDRETGAEVPA